MKIASLVRLLVFVLWQATCQEHITGKIILTFFESVIEVFEKLPSQRTELQAQLHSWKRGLHCSVVCSSFFFAFLVQRVLSVGAG